MLPNPMLAAMLSQTFEMQDLFVVGLLIILEGTLSVDNALVLGLLAKRLPPGQRKRALTYGLVGAFSFRILAIFFAALLLSWPVVKLLGGGYLLYVAVKHLFFTEKHEDEHVTIGPDGHPIYEDADHTEASRELSPDEREEEIAKRNVLPAAADPSAPEAQRPQGKPIKYASFWPTVFVIELTDIAFAVDSILAALAFIPRPPAGATVNPKLWVVIVGGCIGLVLMRFAAVMFIRLLEKFPRFEVAAYMLVLVIGSKLVIDYLGNKLFGNEAEHYHPVNFHDTSSPWFWGFWIAMLICFFVGFSKTKKTSPPAGPAAA
ncbi:MAG TPA: hypothetical protein VF595_01650 [Tepidisphaeraceae bacterium]|jgi:YkoY family integral membrane protein